MNQSCVLFVAIVDDDKRLRRSLGRLLRAADVQSLGCHSAEAFLGDAGHPAIHCLALDVRPGGLSGIELQQQLTAAGKTTPVIVLTFHDEPGTREQALTSGCAAHFSKAVSGSEIVKNIRRAAA